MKRLLYLVTLLILTHFTYGESSSPEEAPLIKVEFLTSNEFRCDPKYHEHFDQDVGHPKVALDFTRLPVNEELTLSMHRLKIPSFNKVMDFLITEGRLVSEGCWKEPFFVVSSRGFLPGERITLRIESHSSDFKKEISFIPNPIEFKSKKSDFRLEAELLMETPAVYSITLYGLDLNGEIKIQSLSLQEKVEQTLVTPQEQMTILYSFDVQGASQGTGILTVNKANGDKVIASFPWGKQLDRYVRGEKIYARHPKVLK